MYALIYIIVKSIQYVCAVTGTNQDLNQALNWKKNPGLFSVLDVEWTEIIIVGR